MVELLFIVPIFYGMVGNTYNVPTAVYLHIFTLKYIGDTYMVNKYLLFRT